MVTNTNHRRRNFTFPAADDLLSLCGKPRRKPLDRTDSAEISTHIMMHLRSRIRRPAPGTKGEDRGEPQRALAAVAAFTSDSYSNSYFHSYSDSDSYSYSYSFRSGSRALQCCCLIR